MPKTISSGLVDEAKIGLPDRGAGRDDSVQRRFKAGQIPSASMVALAHGTNDAQKTMGIITLTLITAGACPTTRARRSG